MIKKQQLVFIQTGFSLIELIVVMAILGVLIGIVTTSLLNSKQKASLNSTITSLTSDITSQQTKAMIGEGSLITDKGIYFEPNRYILFTGNLYNATDAANFVVSLDDSLQFTNITFPDSTLIFASMSGEMINFATPSSTIGIKNTINNELKTININRYGVITEIQ